VSDRELMLLYYELADRPRPRTWSVERKMREIEELIFAQHFRGLANSFWGHALREEPQWLATETIYKALATAFRRSARYTGEKPFGAWLRGIARNIRVNHALRHPISDAEVIAKICEAADEGHWEKELARWKNELDGRYRQCLTDWFRKGSEQCGLNTRPEAVKVLVDEAFEQVFARAAEFDPEDTAFIVWLSNIAKAVFAAHAVHPIRKLPDVPEYLGRQDFEIAHDIAAAETPPDERLMMAKLTDPRIRQAWMTLTEIERYVVWSVGVKGNSSPQQTADRLGRALGTVNNALSRGREKLRAALGEQR
jgi:DNA-directed RNA polymerase specialized sigma24 family protein